MKTFTLTVDDNIRALRELTEAPRESLFDHPYLAVFKRLHNTYHAKIQLNLFYREGDFTLSDMTDRYRDEWASASDWLKLSFHSDAETPKPYENSGYQEVFTDADRVHREILRFAGSASLAQTTTLHFCLATREGLRALKNCGIIGLLGLYGSDTAPRGSYQNSEDAQKALRRGETAQEDGITYAAIDLILNQTPLDTLPKALSPYLARKRIAVMIHEQYFYPDYHRYQADFEDKLTTALRILTENQFKSVFFEETVTKERILP